MRLATSGIKKIPKVFESFRKPDCVLRQAYGRETHMSDILCLLEFTLQEVTTEASRDQDERVQNLQANLLDVLKATPDRGFAMNISIAKRADSYSLTIDLVDHQARRLAVIPDCFGAGLLEMMLVFGHLSLCQKERLGFLPCFMDSEDGSLEKSPIVLRRDENRQSSLLNEKPS